MRSVLMFLLICLVTLLYADEDLARLQIIERIKPIGSVRIDTGAHNVILAAASASNDTVEKGVLSEPPGQAIYEKYCIACHQEGLAGAPKFQNKSDWEPRMAKKKIDLLVATAIKGLNAMPANGTCGDCSKEDMKNAIEYMLPRQ